jgi:hypothetical protein
MLEPREVTVLGNLLTIQTLPSSQGLEAVVRIGHLLAGAAEGFGYSETGKIEDMPTNIPAAIAGMLRKMDAKETPAFIKRLVVDSVPNGKLTGEQYEVMFAGQYDALWELVEKIIEHNRFGDALKKRLSPLFQDLFFDGKAKASIPSTSDP